MIRRQASGVRCQGIVAVAIVLLGLAGCSSTPRPSVRVEAPPKTEKPAAASTRPGGYYQDDGPGENAPPNLDAIPDAEPKPEPLHKFANRPYTVLGQTYTPDVSGKPYQARGIASWYGKKFHGQRTSIGETYDMYAMTAAHPTLPIPSYVRVANPKTGKAVIVRVNDRGPFHADRLIDLSYTAAHKLGIISMGSGLVDVESIDPANWAPAPSEDKPQRVASAEGAGFWLQLGAFSVQANAEQLLAKLKMELSGLADALRIQTVDGLYRLRAGPFQTSGEANDAAVQLKRVTDIQPVLLR